MCVMGKQLFSGRYWGRHASSMGGLALDHRGVKACGCVLRHRSCCRAPTLRHSLKWDNVHVKWGVKTDDTDGHVS